MRKGKIRQENAKKRGKTKGKSGNEKRKLMEWETRRETEGVCAWVEIDSMPLEMKVKMQPRRKGTEI